MNKNLRAAYVQWIEQYVWDWFCTLTFRKFVTPAHAEKLLKAWIRDLERVLYGSRRSRRDQFQLHVIAAFEYTKAERRLHIHAVVYGVAGLSRTYAESTWRNKHGDAQVKVCEETRAFASYMLKQQGDDYIGIFVSRNLRSHFGGVSNFLELSYPSVQANGAPEKQPLPYTGPRRNVDGFPPSKMVARKDGHQQFAPHSDSDPFRVSDIERVREERSGDELLRAFRERVRQHLDLGDTRSIAERQRQARAAAKFAEIRVAAETRRKQAGAKHEPVQFHESFTLYERRLHLRNDRYITPDVIARRAAMFPGTGIGKAIQGKP